MNSQASYIQVHANTNSKSNHSGINGWGPSHVHALTHVDGDGSPGRAQEKPAGQEILTAANKTKDTCFFASRGGGSSISSPHPCHVTEEALAGNGAQIYGIKAQSENIS